MQNNNYEWLKRCFNCMAPIDAPDAKCTKCGWDIHNRENANGALEQTVLKDQYVVGKNLGMMDLESTTWDLILHRNAVS